MDNIAIPYSSIKHTGDIHTDAGGWGFTWMCPDCHATLTWAPGRWWRVECCRTWDVDIKVTGEKLPPSDKDLQEAKKHFDKIYKRYLKSTKEADFIPAFLLLSLLERYNAGERSQELYDAMMAVE